MTEILRKGGISNMKKPLVAVTLGDPAGIGPEIVVKTVADKDLFEEANCIVIGDAGIRRARECVRTVPPCPCSYCR